MKPTIPDIILNDAKLRGFSKVRYAGEFDGLKYFNYVSDNTTHYSGLPAIVKLIKDTHIEDVTALKERLRAYNYAISEENKTNIIELN